MGGMYVCMYVCMYVLKPMYTCTVMYPYVLYVHNCNVMYVCLCHVTKCNETPWCMYRTCMYVHDNVCMYVCMLCSAAVDQRKCNTLSYRQNCKEYQVRQYISLTYIAQIEIFDSIVGLWSLYAFPSFPCKHGAEAPWGSSKKCSFPYKASTATKKVVVI